MYAVQTAILYKYTIDDHSFIHTSTPYKCRGIQLGVHVGSRLWDETHKLLSVYTQKDRKTNRKTSRLGRQTSTGSQVTGDVTAHLQMHTFFVWHTVSHAIIPVQYIYYTSKVTVRYMYLYCTSIAAIIREVAKADIFYLMMWWAFLLYSISTY